MVCTLFWLDMSEGKAYTMIISLSGSTGAASLSFILPGAIYYSVYGCEKGWRSSTSVGLMVVGVLLLVIEPGFIIMQSS